MKQMLWILAIVGLTFLGDRLSGWIIAKQVKSSQFRFSRLYDGRAEADILLLGNSRGLSFYQPSIEKLTQKKTFNLSYNGMPVDVALVLAKDYFERYPAPEKLLIDVTLTDRLDPQQIAWLRMYEPYSNNIRDLLLSHDPRIYYSSQVSHLYRYNSELFWRARFLHQHHSDTTWITDRTISPNMTDDQHFTEPYRINYQPGAQADYALDQLAAIVNTAQKAGTEVELLINPYFPKFQATISNLDSLQQAVTTKTGLPVHDFSTAITTTHAFGDYQHLNAVGAELFAKTLVEAGILSTKK